MAKYKKRIIARRMRSEGESVRVIAKGLDVSKSTVSIWVRDIILSVDQMEKLLQRRIKGGELGRIKGSLVQKRRRIELQEKMKKEGIKRFKDFSEREFFVSGLAIYWAEGSKKTREVAMINSDPRMIKFMINWFRHFFNIDDNRISARVGINLIHKDRESVVKKYWSDVTGVPIHQFRNTNFKKTANLKIYDNFNQHFGTLTVKILKPKEVYYKIMGLIGGMATSQPSQ
jgi:predicted transcriptional regulator